MFDKLPLFELGRIRVLRLSALTCVCAFMAEPSVAEITAIGEGPPRSNVATVRTSPLASTGSETAEISLRCYQGGREVIAAEGYQFVQLGRDAQSGEISLKKASDKSQLSLIGFGDTVCVVNIED